MIPTKSVFKMPAFLLIILKISFLVLILLNFSPVFAQPAQDLRLPSENDGGVFCGGTTTPATCPVNCFRADPVCGDDGVTYWCGCPDALCHGARVAKQGACDVGNGVSLSLPGQALLLIHIVWLILLGFSMLFGLF